jgi:hypothetical protein
VKFTAKKFAQDKLARHITNVNKVFIGAYYSWQKGWDTVVLPNGSCPAAWGTILGEKELLNSSLYKYLYVKKSLKIISIPLLRRRAYCDVIQLFRGVEPTPEEFVLVRALVYSTFGLFIFKG